MQIRLVFHPRRCTDWLANPRNRVAQKLLECSQTASRLRTQTHFSLLLTKHNWGTCVVSLDGGLCAAASCSDGVHAASPCKSVTFPCQVYMRFSVGVNCPCVVAHRRRAWSPLVAQMRACFANSARPPSPKKAVLSDPAQARMCHRPPQYHPGIVPVLGSRRLPECTTCLLDSVVATGWHSVRCPSLTISAKLFSQRVHDACPAGTWHGPTRSTQHDLWVDSPGAMAICGTLHSM